MRIIRDIFKNCTWTVRTYIPSMEIVNCPNVRSQEEYFFRGPRSSYMSYDLVKAFARSSLKISIKLQVCTQYANIEEKRREMFPTISGTLVPFVRTSYVRIHVRVDMHMITLHDIHVHVSDVISESRHFYIGRDNLRSRCRLRDDLKSIFPGSK